MSSFAFLHVQMCETKDNADSARVQTLTWAAYSCYSVSFFFVLALPISVEPHLKDDLVAISYDRFLFCLSCSDYLHMV